MIDGITALIKDLVAHKYEEEWFEFKVNWFEPRILGEYVSALSNAAALAGREHSYMIWGIEHKTHKVVGTNFDYRRNVNSEPLTHFLARQTKPDIALRFQETIFQGKRLVILIIPTAKKVPTSFDKTRFLRIGSSKVNLINFPEHESQLFSVLRNGVPTLENTESEYQELTFEQLFVYYSVKGITLNKKTFLKNLGLLTTDGKYNMLAQLLSDNPHIPIRFSLFKGKTKASPMYAVREFGNMSLLMALDRVLDYGKVLNVPQADETNRIVERKEVMLFDNDAFREAIINAFLHNMWVKGNEPMFTVYDDRIEILSRGKLPPEQTVEGFFAGESVPVNAKLSEIFLQLHISEKSGRGVPKIIEIYGKNAFDFRENSIVVTIPFYKLDLGSATQVDTQVDTQVEDQISGSLKSDGIKQKILDFCINPKSIKEISEYLGFKERKSTSKYLKQLLESGMIAMTIPDKPNSSKQKYVTIK